MISSIIMFHMILAFQEHTPMQNCEIRTRSWCLISAGVDFDERTIDNDTRVWYIYGGYLGNRRIEMTEAKSCGGAFSESNKIQEYQEKPSTGRPGATMIKWLLNQKVKCTVSFKIPFVNGSKDELSYEFVMSAISACTVNQCPGPSLSEAERIHGD